MSVEDLSVALRALLQSSGVRRVVITGGEPLLQQKVLIEVFEALSYGFDGMVFEFETNGTIEPMEALEKFDVWYNVSPKLATSGNERSARYKPDVLKRLNALKSAFKFVLSAPEDVHEIERIVKECELTNVWLMAEGTTKEAQIKGMAFALPIAEAMGWSISPRLHILAFGARRKT